MIFTEQLLDQSLEPLEFNEQSTTKDGKSKMTKRPLTFQKVVEKCLLGLLAGDIDPKVKDDFNSTKNIEVRYDLFHKIQKDPENVELSKDEKQLLTKLVPFHFDIIVSAQLIKKLK